MDRKELTERIKAANQSWTSRIRTELQDIQYDSDADMLYLVWGTVRESFSFPLEFEGEDVYLRVAIDTYEIVGVDIPHIRKKFLAAHQDAREAFEPFFALLGNEDWRIQFRVPSAEKAGEAQLLRPYAYRPSDYFSQHILKAAPDLVPA